MSPEATADWAALREAMRKRFGEARWRSWIAALELVEDGDVLVLAAPSRFRADWVRREIAPDIARLVGREVRIIHREGIAA